jgi:hypothetical protein
MTKEEALAFDLALEALENGIDGQTSTEMDKAITAIKQARALDKMAENARELGLDYEPVATLFGSLPVYDTTPPSAQPAPVPEGMKLVPVEPTQGMVKAFQDAMALEFGMRTTAGYHARVYSAMLAAAPAQQEPVQPVDGTQVSKVWWDGEKLMAKPIPLEDFYQPVQPVGTYGEIYESMQALLRSGLQRDQQIYTAMKDRPLYTTPPAQPAVPLTDEQKLMCWSRATHDADVEHKTEHQCLMDYGSEIEAAHGITKDQP